jgi:hypothetical protein
MKGAPQPPRGVKDQTLLKFLTDVSKVLNSAVDVNKYSVTVNWSPPFDLSCPLPSGNTRTEQPDGIILLRAVLVSDPATVVSWGASTTWTWRGDNTARILDQAGLVEGVRYTLVFQVVG